MPKRVIDGEALWTSDKVAQLRRDFQAEFAYLVPLAAGNGTFECDPRLIWRTAYSYGRPHITPETVAEILDEFARVKILFRWRANDGKTYGYWVGISKEGRLPPASRVKHERQGPNVPQDLLLAFLSSPVADGQPAARPCEPDAKPPASQRLTDGCIGMGLGMGIGSGMGSGGRLAAGGEVGTSLPVPFSPSKSEQRSESQETRGAGAEPRIREDKPKISESIDREEELSPAKESLELLVLPDKKVECEHQEREDSIASAHTSLGTIKCDFAPQIRNKPVFSHRELRPIPATRPVQIHQTEAVPQTNLGRGLDALKVKGTNFDPLDFAFSCKEDFGGLPPKELRRTVYYHWRVAKKKYWSTPQARIDSEKRLEVMLPKMHEQVPEKFSVPGSATSEIRLADPDCARCHGHGGTAVDHPSYPPGMYQVHETCECVTVHPAPWRLEHAVGL